MPTFDVNPTQLVIFKIDDEYLFSQYFDQQDVFDELQDYYNDDAYRFEIPAEEFDTVSDRLEDAYFEPTVVTELEPYCVVIDKYDEHAEILRNSVVNWERSGKRFFLMKDDLAVKEAVERGATRISETISATVFRTNPLPTLATSSVLGVPAVFHVVGRSHHSMPDCPYCERSFEDESAIREHLYEDHEYDELSRIDSKRVDEYVEEHGLEASDEADNGGVRDTIEEVTLDDSSGSFSDERWELEDVHALSTTEIRDKLAEFGIETAEESFRGRATDVNAATALADQWEDEYDVSVTGYDHDFLWMAAEVLWERWTPDIPNEERIYDFYREGSDLFENGEDAEGCQRWLTAWDFIAAVTPDEITSVEDADDHLPAFLSLDHFLRTLSEHLETVAETDPSYHERRIEFCRAVCDRFPDTDDELLLDLRHALADSFGALGRDDERAAELDSLIEEYPDDPWAYFKMAEQSRQLPPEATSVDELERAVELYQQALERDIEQQPTVEERLEEVEHRLDEARNKEGPTPPDETGD